jgi:hypothetical protein
LFVAFLLGVESKPVISATYFLNVKTLSQIVWVTFVKVQRRLGVAIVYRRSCVFEKFPLVTELFCGFLFSAKSKPVIPATYFPNFTTLSRIVSALSAFMQNI